MKASSNARKHIAAWIGSLLVFSPVTVLAGNGLSDFAFSARAYGMGGADLATTDDANSVNANPAGLSHIDKRTLGVYIEPFANFGLRHTDDLGNDKRPDHPYASSLGLAYAQRIQDSALVAGIGLFAQGGAGFAYSDLNTPFGTVDELRSSFATIKLAPGIGWQPLESLRIGLAIGINYSSARQKAFPNTSFFNSTNPQQSFYGFRVDSQSGWSVNGKAGFQYQPHPQWVIGGAYTSKTKVKLEDGTLKINYDDLDLGRVTYDKSSQQGLNLPEEAGLGLSYATADRAWLIAAEANWLNWSSALKGAELKASRPNNPQAPLTLSFPSRLDWRDQYVIAVGVEHRYSEITTLRGGFNYGRNPVPDETLSPMFPLIGTTAFTAGFSRKLSGPWTFSLAALYQLPIKIRYDNPNSLFGPSNTESFDAAALQFMFSRSW